MLDITFTNRKLSTKKKYDGKKAIIEELQNLKTDAGKKYGLTFEYQCKRCPTFCSRQPEKCQCYANSLRYLGLDVMFAPFEKLKQIKKLN